MHRSLALTSLLGLSLVAIGCRSTGTRNASVRGSGAIPRSMQYADSQTSRTSQAATTASQSRTSGSGIRQVSHTEGASRRAGCSTDESGDRAGCTDAGRYGVAGGCGRANCQGCARCDYDVPRELKKVSLPDYVVEPPDILLIEVTNSLRPVTAPLRAGEALQVQVANTLPLDELDDEVRRSFKQINGVFRIQPDGMIYFGPEYGSVPVRGLTVAEAGRSIEIHLRKILKAPQVYVRIASDQARQMPDKDCSFGYFPTKWRPWDTCCEQPQAEPTPINVAPGAPYDAQLTIPGGAMPDGLPPGSVIYENGQPVPVPVFRGDGHGTIVAPPAGSPGIESAIPVPSTGDFQLGVADPDQFPLPPIHPGNQPPVAPPPPGSGVPGSDVPGSGLPGGGVPGGVLVPGPNGIVLPPGSTPGVLVPGGPAPSGLPGTPQRVPVLPAAPLPAATPEDGSILIPDPLESTPAATVPPAPETAQFIPMQPFPMSGPVQPTSHTSRTRQHSFQEIRSDTDDAGWRVMQGYYGRQAGPVSSDRYERSLSRSRTF